MKSHKKIANKGTPKAAARLDPRGIARSSALELEGLKWIFTLALSVCAYLLVAAAINAFYHPDIAKAVELAKQVSANYHPSIFAPEPKEQVLFLSGILVFTVSLFFFYFLSDKLPLELKGGRLHGLFLAFMGSALILVSLLAYLGLAAPNPGASNVQNALDQLAPTNAASYFIGTFVYNHFLIYALVFFPATLLLFLYSDRFSKQTLQRGKRAARILCFLFCGLLIFLVFCITSFRFPYTYENKYDVNAVYYSVVQVFRGAPLLVDNFTNTYGLYPHFILPVLKLTGLSVFSFSSIMAVLLCACFFFMFFLLSKTVESSLLIVFGFSSAVFNSWLYTKIAVSFDAYFQMAPLRWVFPFLLVFYAVLYLRHKSRLLYLSSFFVFAGGILWTPDFGLIAFLSLLIFYSYQEFEQTNIGLIIRNILTHLGLGVVSVFLVFGSYAVLIKLSYGAFPDFGKLLSTLKIFAVVGANMLPMPGTFHPWMLIALIYVVGLLYAISHLLSRNITARSSTVLVLSVLGTGLFSYYIGRSHNGTLLAVPIPFLLLTIFADDLLKLGKTNKAFFFPFGLVLFALSFSFFQIIADGARITALVSETENKTQNAAENSYIEGQAGFIRSCAQEGEKVLVLTAPWHQSFCYDLSHTAAAINPGLVDLFFKSDYERILSFLTTNDQAKIFLDPTTYQFFDAKVAVILSSLYQVEKRQENNGNMIYFSKRKADTSSAVLLKQGDNTVLHELPENDLKRKFQFENGENGQVTLGKQFTVEVIFRPLDLPASPLSDGEVLLGNSSESRGLMLMKADSSGYIASFGNSNEGIRMPVTLNQWNYLVFEVDDMNIQAFANGKFVGRLVNKSPFQDSDGPLYIGNKQLQGGFFFGDIREINISRGPLDHDKVAQTWETVSK